MLGFIVAIAGGFFTPQAEPILAKPVADMAGKYITLEAGELRLLAFILVMLVVGIVSALLASGSTFWVILGGTLGYFGKRIVAAAKAAIPEKDGVDLDDDAA